MKRNDPKYMICYNARRFCVEDISKIENFDQMMADSSQIWCCHHRREINENKSASQLINEGLYYKRPACELIFMTDYDHKSLHNKGKHISEETRKKQSESHKGNKYAVGERSEKVKHNISEAMKGRRWFNNGINQVFAKECPEGYESGMLKKNV